MLGVTKGIEGWKSQSNNVERLMDNASYTSAHPDDTLVLAGPPRFSDVQLQATTGWDSLLPIGMMQTFQLTSQKPTQPLMAIGSGRSFFVSGKSQTTWRIGRLFCNGRNLLRVLYHNVAAENVPIQNFDDPPVPLAGSALTPFYINLDSELFYIPFGLAVIFRDKAKDNLGAGYLELSMLNTYTMGFTAGQNMIMEDVGGMCDRVFPFSISDITGAPGVSRQTIDTVIGFADVSDQLPTGNSGSNFLFENNPAF
jgi:hypothetical protein